MEINSTSKWQLRIATLIIFLLGFCAGGLTLHLYQARFASSAAEPRDRSRGGAYRRAFDQLNLTTEQRTQVDKIMDNARAQFEEARKDSEPRMEVIRNQVTEQLQKVLTPEQWQQFEKMREEWRGRHHHGHHHGDRDDHKDHKDRADQNQ